MQNMQKICAFDSKKDKIYNVSFEQNIDDYSFTIHVEDTQNKWRCKIPLEKSFALCVRENMLVNYTIDEYHSGIDCLNHLNGKLCLKQLDGNREIYFLILEEKKKEEKQCNCCSNIRTVSSNIESTPTQELKVEKNNSIDCTGPTGTISPSVLNKEIEKIDDAIIKKLGEMSKLLRKVEMEQNTPKIVVAPSMQEQIIEKINETLFADSFAKVTLKVEGKLMGLDFNASVEKRIEKKV